MQQAAAGYAASWESHPSEDLSEPPHAVTRARREYQDLRCLLSPYGCNHQPSAAERIKPLRSLGSPPSSAGSSGDVLTEGIWDCQAASERLLPLACKGEESEILDMSFFIIFQIYI